MPGYTGGGTVKGNASLPVNPDGTFGLPPLVGGDIVQGKAAAAVEAATTTVKEAEAAFAEADAAMQDAESTLRDVERSIQSEQKKKADAVRRLNKTRSQFESRAVAAYIGGGEDATFEAVVSSEDFEEANRRLAYVGVVAQHDAELITSYLKARQAAGKALASLADDLDAAERRAAESSAARQGAFDVLEAAAADLLSAQGEVIVDLTKTVNGTPGVAAVGASTALAFPVAGPFNFIDSFGFARSGGRQHQGADIFSPMGTPLVAIEAGTVQSVGTNSLGGLKLWVYGDSGNRYYYAHLSSFAEGLTDGMRVEAGQLVGHNGDSGNAKGTPPHLHFEIHPSGYGNAANPYPLLSAIALSLPKTTPES